MAGFWAEMRAGFRAGLRGEWRRATEADRSMRDAYAAAKGYAERVAPGGNSRAQNSEDVRFRAEWEANRQVILEQTRRDDAERQKPTREDLRRVERKLDELLRRHDHS